MKRCTFPRAKVAGLPNMPLAETMSRCANLHWCWCIVLHQLPSRRSCIYVQDLATVPWRLGILHGVLCGMID